MEMTIAFYLNKPIYVLNDLPVGADFLEELMSQNPTILHGDLYIIQNSTIYFDISSMAYIFIISEVHTIIIDVSHKVRMLLKGNIQKYKNDLK